MDGVALDLTPLESRHFSAKRGMDKKDCVFSFSLEILTSSAVVVVAVFVLHLVLLKSICVFIYVHIYFSMFFVASAYQWR